MSKSKNQEKLNMEENDIGHSERRLAPIINDLDRYRLLFATAQNALYKPF